MASGITQQQETKKENHIYISASERCLEKGRKDTKSKIIETFGTLNRTWNLEVVNNTFTLTNGGNILPVLAGWTSKEEKEIKESEEKDDEIECLHPVTDVVPEEIIQAFENTDQINSVITHATYLDEAQEILNANT